MLLRMVKRQKFLSFLSSYPWLEVLLGDWEEKHFVLRVRLLKKIDPTWSPNSKPILVLSLWSRRRVFCQRVSTSLKPDMLSSPIYSGLLLLTNNVRDEHTGGSLSFTVSIPITVSLNKQTVRKASRIGFNKSSKRNSK